MKLPLVVGLGGAAGAGLRHGLQSLMGTQWWPLLLINVAGSVIIGWLLGRRFDSEHPIWAGIGVGFCGALTSFSSFALQVARRLDGGHWRGGLGIVGATTVAAVAAAGAGYWIGSEE